ncbi:hypothetical protein Tco_0326817 [Tanacetum coccineum]
MTDVDVNAPAELAPTMAPPTRTDDQILPHIRWVPIGKSNCYLDVDRPQSNPIFKIAVDLLKHTNFFRAFTASSAIPAIYIQQFWDTIRYDKIAGGYKCQLDEQWFDLSKDTLRDALQITPVDRNNAFSSPPTPDALIKFVNDLGYPKVVRHLSDVVTNDMFQPWRALTTIINLCLTGKTSGFERPRAPVLQILWGVINRAHIDYAERMWEEFTQSIHTFIEDKKNLAQHTQGKKKATLIVIPSIRFTKLIIHYLQSKHKFHARPGSPLHLPNEEPVLGYLKFSSKGTKREVFGMPIPNDLVTDDIRGKQYYNAYLEKVAKHQRYLAGEDVSDPDSPAPKPTKGAKPKTTKKPTSTQQTKPKTKPSIAKTTKSTPSQPPKPKPAPAKPQEKKRKRALDAAEAPSQAKRSKAGRVSKKRTLQLRDEFIDEGVPATEPRVDDEEAIVQKVLEESMKDAYPAHRGPLPPVVFREPDSGKLQPLPEVQGKGKEKVGEEQAAQVLLNLQTPKKKNPAEQFIFQRHKHIFGILKRIWEKFTQSIHTFIEDKKNIAQHTQGKKKSTLIVISSIRFTKLIIHYLQSKHKFHARPSSTLHLPNEEPALGYLKFNSKGTKWEVFGMPILNDLITDDIRGKQYYNDYLEKVAKHQRYLAGEDVSDPDSLAPKPTKRAKPKTTKKPTSTQKTKPKTKPSIAKTTKSTPSQPPKPKPAPAKPQEKKRKRALDAAEAPSLAKHSKAGRVSKKRTLQLRDEFIDEGVPATEPRIDDE